MESDYRLERTVLGIDELGGVRAVDTCNKVLVVECQHQLILVERPRVYVRVYLVVLGCTVEKSLATLPFAARILECFACIHDVLVCQIVVFRIAVSLVASVLQCLCVCAQVGIGGIYDVVYVFVGHG